MKKLIINADDFGYSKVFNEKILELLEKGLITSTTVMVNWVDEKQEGQINKLINFSKEKPVSIGLHLEFIDRNFGEEIERQYKLFKELFSLEPSHIDLHKWAFIEDSYPLIQKFCKEKGLPCRNSNVNSEDVIMTDGEVFNTMKKDFSEIELWVKSLDDNKTYEILFHPGTFDQTSKSSFNKEREDDVRNILRLNEILEINNVRLISFRDL